MAFLKYGNPVVWSFWIVYATLWLAWAAITFIPTVVREVGQFMQLAFAYTHTDDRKLCFLDAVFGAAVGIYYGNPLVGAVAGGLVGKLYSPLTRRAAMRLRERFEAKEI